MDTYQDDAKEAQMSGGTAPKKPVQPEMKPAPTPSKVVDVPKDLSHRVDFLHPWMNEILNQIVLMLMFLMLVVATLIVLRTQDIG
jgi:hypothetical protein